MISGKSGITYTRRENAIDEEKVTKGEGEQRRKGEHNVDGNGGQVKRFQDIYSIHIRNRVMK